MSLVWKSREVHNVCWARFTDEKPSFIREQKRVSGRRGQGIRYEQKCQRYLQELYGLTYFASPWLQYREYEHEILRWCQPDGLLIDVEKGIITLIEIKYQHTFEAYRQLYRCYRPVLEYIFSPQEWTYHFVEVVKWFDVSVPLPHEPQLCKLPHYASAERMGVHIWRP